MATSVDECHAVDVEYDQHLESRQRCYITSECVEKALVSKVMLDIYHCKSTVLSELMQSHEQKSACHSKWHIHSV
jgi:hypothetical protein